MEFNYAKMETFIPEEYVYALREELNKAGALTTDDCYDYCMAVSKVKGSWRPLEGTNPFKGSIGEIYESSEAKVEFTCRTGSLKAAAMAIKRVHPYEKPVINVIPLLETDRL